MKENIFVYMKSDMYIRKQPYHRGQYIQKLLRDLFSMHRLEEK